MKFELNVHLNHNQNYILVTTTGGSGESDPCVFPFKYKGNLYYECITLDRNTPWY